MNLLSKVSGQIPEYNTVKHISFPKTLYYSRKFTGSLTKIVLSKKVLANFDNNIGVSIANRFIMGVTEYGATHPQLGKSKLSIDSGASVELSSDIGPAIVGPCSILNVEGHLQIGNSYINSHCRILCEELISIGDGCAVSWNVEFLDTDRHQVSYDGDNRKLTDPIVVEDNVLIGNNSLIKKGCTIGDGSVVASGSVVVDDVPQGALVAGNPAKVIKRNVTWS